MITKLGVGLPASSVTPPQPMLSPARVKFQKCNCAFLVKILH